MCKHEVEHLIGTSDGIKCRLCGKVFKTFAELEADRPQEEKPVAEQADATEVISDEEKEIDEIVEELEKPVEKKTTKKSTTKKGGKK